MTTFEKSQDNVVFLNAGRKAFRLGVYVQDNPYKDNPFKTLWQKGWLSESRKYKRGQWRKR